MKIPYNRKTVGTFGIDELTKLNAKTLHAVLATAHDNIPYTSLVAYVFDHKEKVFLFLTPRKTTKYSNILRNPNISLLIGSNDASLADRSGNAEAGPFRCQPLLGGKTAADVSHIPASFGSIF